MSLSDERIVSARAEAAELVWASTGGIVASGPWSGLVFDKTPDEWGYKTYASKVCGFYEQELAPVFEAVCRWNPSSVFVVGSGDGYHSAGLARRLPNSKVFAVDISPSAREWTARIAKANLLDNLRVSAEIPHDFGDSSAETAFWLFDVEGAEVELVSPDKIPNSENSVILCELHPWESPDVEKKIAQHFEVSHSVTRLISGGRNPNALPFLSVLPDFLKWSLVSEGRPEAMTWLLLVPRGHEVTFSLDAD